LSLREELRAKPSNLGVSFAPLFLKVEKVEVEKVKVLLHFFKSGSGKSKSFAPLFLKVEVEKVKVLLHFFKSGKSGCGKLYS
jgi:hypothetical protein